MMKLTINLLEEIYTMGKDQSEAMNDSPRSFDVDIHHEWETSMAFGNEYNQREMSQALQNDKI